VHQGRLLPAGAGAPLSAPCTPDAKSLRAKGIFCARGVENLAAKSMAWQIIKASLELERDEVGGTHRPANPRPRRPAHHCSRTEE
jgi:hypothetical protein